VAVAKKISKDFFLNSGVMQRFPVSQAEWNFFMQEWAQTQSASSFTPTLTGWSSGPSGAVVGWRREFNIIHAQYGAVSEGTSDTTTFIITNLPAEITPAANVWTTWAGLATDNGVGGAYYSGTAKILTTGTIQLYPGSDGTGWTAANAKGFSFVGGECYFSYRLFDYT